MPIPVTKYTCEFKCRGRAMDLAASKKHEATCTLNPENKTCRTCSNEDYEFGDVKYERICKVEYINELIGDIYHLLKTDGRHIKPLCQCPNHNIPYLVDEAIMFNYFQDVKTKIENTRKEKEYPLPDDLPF